MNMLICMCGVTRIGIIWNKGFYNQKDNECGIHFQECAGKKVQVVQICHENGLRICGGNSDGDECGGGRKGRPKRRWMGSLNVDLREKIQADTHNRAMRRQRVRNIEPT